MGTCHIPSRGWIQLTADWSLAPSISTHDLLRKANSICTQPPARQPPTRPSHKALKCPPSRLLFCLICLLSLSPIAIVTLHSRHKAPSVPPAPLAVPAGDSPPRSRVPVSPSLVSCRLGCQPFCSPGCKSEAGGSREHPAWGQESVGRVVWWSPSSQARFASTGWRAAKGWANSPLQTPCTVQERHLMSLCTGHPP